MTNEDAKRPGSPFDAVEWTQKLKARVVTPGSLPRVHGYDVEGDLALHYRFSDTVLLALKGELPDDRTGRAFEVAMQFLAPASVAEPPAHCGLLARLCGARTSGVLGVAALAAAEQALFLVEGHADLVEWLERPDGAPPARHLAGDEAERAAVSRLRAALARTEFACPALDFGLGREAALVALLHACGLETSEQKQAAIVMSRLPCALAEAFAVSPTAFREYPMNLPPFEHEE
jgi:hypothetical protein